MFPELHELCRRSIRPVFMSEAFRLFGDALFLSLAGPPWLSLPGNRPAPVNLSRWVLRPCGARWPKRIPMDSKTLAAHAKQVALDLPFTEHCWPFGPEYDVFKVGGKIFMLMGVAHGRLHVSLKSDPQKSLLNQQIYRGSSPDII